jgi:hypothetical protein
MGHLMNIQPAFVRENKFDKQLKLIAKSYRRMDELDRAIEWGLSHDPKQFYNFCRDFYIWKTERLVVDLPQLRILYQYIESQNTVILIAIEEVTE